MGGSDVQVCGWAIVLYLADPASVRPEHRTSHRNDGAEEQGAHEIDMGGTEKRDEWASKL